MANPFDDKLPPGYYSTKIAGTNIYSIFDDEGKHILTTQPDKLIPAETSIHYTWRQYEIRPCPICGVPMTDQECPFCKEEE